jgi:CRP/FNR family transcriptional regulator
MGNPGFAAEVPAARGEPDEDVPEACRRCGVRPLAVCSGLVGAPLHRLAARVVHRSLHAGQAVLSQGDPAEHALTLVAGSVMASLALGDGRRQVLGILDPGAMLGLAVNGRFAHTVTALEPVRVCMLPRPVFEAALSEEPALARAVAERSRHELALAQERMVMLGRKNALEKVASFVLWLSDRAAGFRQDPDLVFVPLTRAEIGDHLGTTVETVSRSLAALRRDGVIDLPRSELVGILDRPRLEGLARAGGE